MISVQNTTPAPVKGNLFRRLFTLLRRERFGLNPALAIFSEKGAVSNATIAPPTTPTQYINHLMFQCSITATADADTTTGNIPHGLVFAPELVIITPIQAAGGLSVWAATTINATNLVLTKSTATGSGAAGAQVIVTALQRVHSLIR
jgi:hypothetical protein